jgi:hypothetical protein
MGYIFETEIEMIINSVRSRTIGEAESIRLKDVLAANIHQAIRAYFRARVEQLLQHERQLEARSKKLPYALPEVLRLQEQIDLLLVHNYEFGRHDFEGMLDHAVHFEFNFLCRPQWTLLNFIFENQRRRPTSDIERKLKYCVDYAYYAEIIRRYIENRGLAELTYEEFGSLLERIDQEIVARHSSVELAMMARPMVRFIEAALPVPPGRPGEAHIPINAAIVFFEDKKLNDIKERLESERDSRGVSDISLLQLANLIEKVRTGDEAAEVLLPEAQHEQSEAPPEHGIPPSSEEKHVSTTDGGDGAVLKAPVKVYSDFDEDAPLAEQSAVQQEQEREPDAASAPPEQMQDMQSLFSATDQKMFVRKIFRKHDIEFRLALDELNKIADWEEAARYLKEIFLLNDVDPFSEEAILFTDKIQSRYLPTGGDEQSS